ncbi:undecaprenyl/decaprenyl-phosphate alpha-N-acetylglucosaminyl 1-phosphate transferase [candidate division TA06 bacterium]|nr:undecaprenyl/decaprenyl-phosphate alpha-N-acetylglucosaminyl 1-phosphate transferase [candidate division TA06 bacterium]
MLNYLLLLMVAFLTALLTGPLARILGRRLAIMDHPDELGMHSNSIPRSGGIAIGMAIWVTLEVCWLLPGVIISNRQLVAMGIGCFGLFVTGLLDDLHEIKPYIKALGLFGAGLMIMLVSRHLTLLGFERMDFLLGIMALVASANALNFLDGMDGLAAGLTVLAGLGFLVLGMLLGDMILACWAAILAGAAGGFWPINKPPARIFMGDSGSLVMGGILGWMLLLLSAHGLIHLLAGFILLSWLVLDTGLAIVRRIVLSRDIFTGDRRHVYDLMHRRYNSVWKTILIMYLFQLIFGLLAVSALYLPWFLPAGMALVLWLGILACMIRMGMFAPLEADGPAVSYEAKRWPRETVE